LLFVLALALKIIGTANRNETAKLILVFM